MEVHKILRCIKAPNVRLCAPMNHSLRAATVAAFVAFATTSALALPNPTDTFPARGGPIKITPIYHASLQIEYEGFVIQVDPFSAGDYMGAKKADLILITHTHPDHFDLKEIQALSKEGRTTFVVAPPDAKSALEAQKIFVIVMRNRLNPEFVKLKGGRSDILQYMQRFPVDFKIQAVPSYNIVRGPKPGQKYHPKGEFNGYILTMGGKRIYIAGDTEATPEMKALKHIDIAFIPMNLPYTMTPQEAAQGVRAFKPKVVYPYHYRFPFDKPNDNPQQFQKALVGSGIDVRIRGWYAHGAAK